MIFLNSQINELEIAKTQYHDACRQDEDNAERAKLECKRLLISPKGLGAIAGLGILRGTIGKTMSGKQAGMIFGRRLLSAWLGGIAPSGAEGQGEEALSNLSETQV